MIIVLDTNVLVSGMFFAGVPLEILERWDAGEFDLAVSPSIVDEYRQVIQRLQAKYGLSAADQILDVIQANGVSVIDTELPVAVCNDPEDDKFLACAIEAGAQAVITGDRQLLQSDGYQGIAVLRPREFLDRLS